jgi:hypothetical protein
MQTTDMKAMEPRIYLYKMTTDNGGAPCVWHGTLSLAICKGVIRRMSKKGSIIFGFGAKGYGERLLYIAEVTDKPDTGKYYRERSYRNRPDCIYEEMPDGTACRKEGAEYHNKSNERVRDVGKRFERADVLLSNNFRYFGKAGTDDYKELYPTIRAVIEHLTRGHRVNHEQQLRRDLLELKATMWRNPTKVQGKPTSSDRSKKCNSGKTLEVCG